MKHLIKNSYIIANEKQNPKSMTRKAKQPNTHQSMNAYFDLSILC
jgi:hypothetical protein